ncbi:MAG: ABC transporter permease, partial [Candidatus Methanoperedens sp.]
MKKSINNLITIAQKEFADNIWSPVFLLLLITFTLIVFTFSYQGGLFVERVGSQDGNALLNGFATVLARVTGFFAPLIGFALGFDAVVKEIKSGSLNVLLTHPVFRDNIISGKILGSLLTLALVIAISTLISIGTLLLMIGGTLSGLELERIVIFSILTFFYSAVFLGIGVILSIVVKDAADSLVYNVVIWLVFCVVFGAIIIAIATILTGQSFGPGTSSLELALNLANISPLHHYAEVTMGRVDFSWGGIGVADASIKGIFDTRFTLSQWFGEFWMNLTVLIVTPIILLIIAFIA